MYVDGSNVLHTKALELGIYNPFYIIPDAGHTSYSSDYFGTVTQPFFDSTVWYMKNFFAYQLGCSNATYVKNNSVKPLNLFPNPTPDEFYLSSVQQYIGQTISIEDISGREIYRKVFDGKLQSTKDIGLTKGVYVVRLINEKTNEI